MAHIFISYRRFDTPIDAERIYAWLTDRFGVDEVFMDWSHIPVGEDFLSHVIEAMEACEYLIVLIGKNWKGSRGGDAAAIHHPADPMRIEIGTALRKGAVIMPILLDDATMPNPSELPDDIRELSYRQAMYFRDADFEYMMEKLSAAIQVVGKRRTPTRGLGRRTLPMDVPIRGSSHSLKPIFLSYRRSDSAGIVGRVLDRARGKFGADAVFIDVEGIPYGRNFRIHIEEALQRCSVILAFVGQNWLGRRFVFRPRIANENDPIRVEIVTAIRLGIPIVPVLLDGALMPTRDSLPAEIQDFSDINAAPLSTGRDFDIHIGRIFESLESFSRT